jgi:hypothetical protein
MRSWHDFHLIGYSVDGKLQSLTFELEWPYESETDIRNAKVQFTGVECYFLEHDLGSNIVYAIEETSLLEHLEASIEFFETECKWGWPKFWRPKPYPIRPTALELADAIARLTSKNVKCFLLSSSYGLSGWVLATSIQHMQIEA